jgi:hypothetical protein
MVLFADITMSQFQLELGTLQLYYYPT